MKVKIYEDCCSVVFHELKNSVFNCIQTGSPGASCRKKKRKLWQIMKKFNCFYAILKGTILISLKYFDGGFSFLFKYYSEYMSYLESFKL